MRCLLRAVPGAVPGIAFLSGGQTGELASARLNAMNVRFKSRVPWALAFSYARAIQQPALEIWRGDQANALAAQEALYHRAWCNRAARRGEYEAAMELSMTQCGPAASPPAEHPAGPTGTCRSGDVITRARIVRPATDAIRESDPRNRPWTNRCPMFTWPVTARRRGRCLAGMRDRLISPLTERGERNARSCGDGSGSLRFRGSGQATPEGAADLRAGRRRGRRQSHSGLREWDYGDYERRPHLPHSP